MLYLSLDNLFNLTKLVMVGLLCKPVSFHSTFQILLFDVACPRLRQYLKTMSISASTESCLLINNHSFSPSVVEIPNIYLLCSHVTR